MSAEKVNEEFEFTVKEKVRSTYGNIAISNTMGQSCGNAKSCCGAPKDVDLEYIKELGYSEDDTKGVPNDSMMGLGCGNPVAAAGLKEGETVLDLGSGGGIDCFIAAKKVGPTGQVIGVDMTPDMVDKARLSAQKKGYFNVDFRLGEIEHLPVADNSIDVVISNCVINLCTDKFQVFREIFRVLKSKGRIFISDMVALQPLPSAIKNDLEMYAACIAGVMSPSEYREKLFNAGFQDINIEINKNSKTFIQKWTKEYEAEKYVVSATVTATKY